ncbi:hypothetical protein V8G54_008011 [Vigna mungo]|uniref:Uncharacterized protein n=1 Tax=Vigna mungo TaxID=3915 RepID=A0AAQ3S9L3_VIGMU
MIDWVDGEVEAEVVQADDDGEQVQGEVQADGDGEQVQGEGDVEAEVDEGEVHDVDDFELQDVHEDDDEDEGGHDDEDEDENVDDSISEESESLVDVRVECDIGTSKGQPCSSEGECSMTSESDAVDDVRGLSDIEWVSDKLDSGPDSEDDDATIPRTLFPTFTMPKSFGGI